MFSFDDGDMKIFGGGSGSREQENPDELLLLASALDRQRNNGNLRKARLLGECIALLTPESLPEFYDSSSAGSPSPLAGGTSADFYQIRVLMVFSAQLTLHRRLSSALLSTEAVNAMYRQLEADALGFYENIVGGSAFSFYYLSVRHNQDGAEEIGKNFAMLCGAEQDESYIRTGAAVFQAVADCVDLWITQSDFLEE